MAALYIYESMTGNKPYCWRLLECKVQSCYRSSFCERKCNEKKEEPHALEGKCKRSGRFAKGVHVIASSVVGECNVFQK
jgi:hypothetical protein